MYPNNYFIHEAEQVLQNCSRSGQWYILYADITDFHAINHVYGMDAGNILLQDFEGYLSRRPVIEFCTRIFADLFLCLFF